MTTTPETMTLGQCRPDLTRIGGATKVISARAQDLQMDPGDEHARGHLRTWPGEREESTAEVLRRSTL